MIARTRSARPRRCASAVRVGALVAVLGAVALLGARAATAGASAGSGDQRAPEPTLRVRAAELARLAEPIALPADRAPRLLFAGDSVADTLATTIAAEARARGAGASTNTRPGCGLLRGVPTTLDGYQPPWAATCDREVSTWRSQLAAAPADVVVILSTWDGSSRSVDGAFVDPGTRAGRDTTVELYRELVDDIAPAGSGRHVVFLAEAIPAPGSTTGDATPTRVAEARQHRATLRALARAMPDRVRVVDVGQWLCPVGPQCPPTIDGVTVRGEDGGHFTPAGAAWITPRILDAVGLSGA